MRLRVLGCSGGIGEGLRTTSFAVDADTLLDAGTGVGDLALEAMARIDHVFITHAHLDHVAALPLMLDTVGWMRPSPVTVYALPAVVDVLRQHLFNWHLWPDFTRIPDEANPWLRFRPVQLGEPVAIGEGRTVRALPAHHVVPAAGWQVDSGQGSLVYTGDTTVNEHLWPEVNAIANLRHLIIETAFSNREQELARVSRHLCPTTLAHELDRLERSAQVHITHLKPGEYRAIMEEIQACAGRHEPRMLEGGEVLEF